MTKNSVLKKITQKANSAQTKDIEYAKYMKGCEIKSDPGVQFIDEWIKLHGSRWRKDFSLSDAKEMLAQMKVIRKGIRERLLWVTKATKNLEDIEEELSVDIGNLEKENGGANGSKTKEG